MKQLFILITLYFILFPSPVSATPPISDVKSAFGINNPFKYTDLGCLVSNAFSWGLIAASLAMLGYLLWGGIQWITSAGEKNGLESAKNKITAAVTGIAIVAATWAIYLIIRFVLGLPVGLDNPQCKITGGGSGGGTGAKPETQTSFVCNQYPCNCCNIYSGKVKDCCEQIGKLAPQCLFGNPKSTAAECYLNENFHVDYNCWGENYTRLLNQGAFTPSTDACKN